MTIPHSTPKQSLFKLKYLCKFAKKKRLSISSKKKNLMNMITARSGTVGALGKLHSFAYTVVICFGDSEHTFCVNFSKS